MRRFDRMLYRRWIAANAWSELLGLGGTLLLGRWVAEASGGPASAAAVLGTALLAIAVGTLLEGVVVGYAQARVVSARLPTLPMPRRDGMNLDEAGLGTSRKFMRRGTRRLQVNLASSS